MSSPKTFALASLVAVGGAIVNVAVVVAGAWMAYRNRRAVHRLLHVDDHMLADIGITRGDVLASLSGSAFEDASTRLGALARERREGRAAQRREILAETRRTPPTGGGLRLSGGAAVLDRVA